jgi:ABC-type glycerol-3-phosphate transport system permease component
MMHEQASAPATTHAHKRPLPVILQRTLVAVAKYLCLLLILVLTLGPAVWVWLSALRSQRELIRDPLGLPTELNWGNFAEAWVVGHFGQYIGNSILITLPVVAGVVFLSAWGGYGLARFEFRGNRLIFYTFLIGLMVPFQAIMIPLYFNLRDMRLLSTYGGMILPSIALGLPFGIFLMRAFFRGLSRELADAALVDGCNEFGVFWRVMFPLTGPAASALAVFQFMWTWNAFLMPLLYLQREPLRPLALGLMFFSGRYDTQYNLLFAGITISTFPIVIAYLLLQRRITQGLTAGALKG